PLRLHLAVPQLGAVPLHGAEARARPEGARQADGRSDARFLLGSRAERGRDRLEGAGAGDGLPGTSGARASVHLVPGWRPPARPGTARLARGAVAVPVAPTVRPPVPAELTGVWGTVRPGLAGTTVTIQRQAGPGWRVVANVKTTAKGRFTLSRVVGPGTYRAR